MHLNIFEKHYIVDVWQGFENATVLNMQRLHTVINMPKYVTAMPKYA